MYGSFLQSRMYREGVDCTDCHDPHTTRLKAEGNAVCAPCHLPEKFDSPDHHFHAEASSGSECVACHMPSRKYMVVDPRRDHSFRVPRPDLSVKIGTPNACTDCHKGQDPSWASGKLTEWYGSDRSREFHFGQAIHAARNWLPTAETDLARVAGDPEAAGIVRATAFSLLPGFLGPQTLGLLNNGVRDPDPLVRLASLTALEGVDPRVRLGMASPLLQDPIRTVRLEASRVLASVPADLFTPEQRTALQAGLEEYGEAQRFNADRAESHLNLGWLHIQRGEMEKAEQEYRTAIRMRSSFTAAYINLADLYRQLGKDQEGEKVLRDAQQATPDDPDAHHALGLLLVRQQRISEAIDELARGAELGADMPYYSYVLGIALHSTGETDRALKVLEEAHERFPGFREILFGLTTINRDRGDREAALRWAEKLLVLSPRDPRVQNLITDLK